jgi:hypothetical protein
MGMLVQHLLMRMLMLVVLDKMQPQAHAHQHDGGNQPDSERLPPRRCSWWRGPLRLAATPRSLVVALVGVWMEVRCKPHVCRVAFVTPASWRLAVASAGDGPS